LCFSRKNKTFGAIFKTKSVLELLEKNYTTYCSLNNKVRFCSVWPSLCLALWLCLLILCPVLCLAFSFVPFQKPVEGGAKAIITKLLEENGFNEKRATKLSQDDFLKSVSVLCPCSYFSFGPL
jgi:hypothetical protein